MRAGVATGRGAAAADHTHRIAADDARQRAAGQCDRGCTVIGAALRRDAAQRELLRGNCRGESDGLRDGVVARRRAGEREVRERHRLAGADVAVGQRARARVDPDRVAAQHAGQRAAGQRHRSRAVIGAVDRCQSGQRQRTRCDRADRRRGRSGRQHIVGQERTRSRSEVTRRQRCGDVEVRPHIRGGVAARGRADRDAVAAVQAGEL